VYLNGQNQWKIDYFNLKKSLGTNYSPNGDTNLWGQNFVSWGVWGDPLVNYSTVYLFFQWLRVHAANTTGIYKEILANPFNDYRAVEAAVQSRFAGYSGAAWKDIFRDWLVANYANAETGFYGYKNDLKDDLGKIQYLYPRYFTSIALSSTATTSTPGFSPEGEAKLVAGDAVYVRLDSNKSFSDSDPLAFDSITTGGSPANIGAGTSFGQNDILIAQNVKGKFDGYIYSTDPLITPSGTTQVGVSTLTPPSASLVPKSAKPVRTRYPMGIILGPESEAPSGAPLLELRKSR
jgi:hypothetical protein